MSLFVSRSNTRRSGCPKILVLRFKSCTDRNASIQWGRYTAKSLNLIPNSDKIQEWQWQSDHQTLRILQPVFFKNSSPRMLPLEIWVTHSCLIYSTITISKTQYSVLATTRYHKNTNIFFRWNFWFRWPSLFIVASYGYCTFSKSKILLALRRTFLYTHSVLRCRKSLILYLKKGH